MELKFEVIGDVLVIGPSRSIRKGWKEAFKKGRKENLLFEEKIFNKFDTEEWEW